MKGVTIFGRKPLPLLISIILVGLCGTGYYYLNEANAKLKPILPPLAAERNLQDWLHTSYVKLMDSEPLFHLGVVTDIYRRSDYRMLWLNNYELSDAGERLLQQLIDTSADSLMEYNYHLSYLRQRLYNLPTRPKEATALDILLTDAFISYAEDVLSNKLSPNYVTRAGDDLQGVSFLPGAENNPHVEHENIISLIVENPRQTGLSRMLTSLHPSHEGYQKLRDALRHYQSVASSGQWQTIPAGPTLRPGDKHPQVALLRKLLSLYGDYPPTKPGSLFDWLVSEDESPRQELDQFDDELATSLKQFQRRHGHKDDGIVGRETRQLLNVPPSQRIKQLSLNMKRWRELPMQLGERYIWVNMTDFRLDVMQRGHSIMDMKVIVGKTSRRTPVMQQSISSVVLNPSWNVPHRIMVKDILPQARKDPTYLASRKIRIIDGWTDALEIPYDQVDLQSMPLSRFPYRLQQDPGAQNALGMVKFIIPNDYSIYLHDTNSPELFERDYRALSSGCIRVEKPMALAELLLQGRRGWDKRKIDEVIAEGETTYVRLPEDIPTYLLYWTAWVDDEDVIQFRDDIYNEDKAVAPDGYDLEALVL